MPEDNRPAKTIRMGSCSAAIWKNVPEQDGQSVAQYSVTPQRCYRDKDGNMQNATSLFPGHLPQMIVLLIRCMWWISKQEESTTDVAASAGA